MSDYLQDLDDAEKAELRQVAKEFSASVNDGYWERQMVEEAKRRASQKRQDALRKQYLVEVGKLQNAEEKLQVRAKYRKLGLDI